MAEPSAGTAKRCASEWHGVMGLLLHLRIFCVYPVDLEIFLNLLSRKKEDVLGDREEEKMGGGRFGLGVLYLFVWGCVV